MKMYITKACLLHQSTELLATSHSTNTTVHSRLPTSRITTTLPSTAMTKGQSVADFKDGYIICLHITQLQTIDGKLPKQRLLPIQTRLQTFNIIPPRRWWHRFCLVRQETARYTLQEKWNQTSVRQQRTVNGRLRNRCHFRTPPQLQTFRNIPHTKGRPPFCLKQPWRGPQVQWHQTSLIQQPTVSGRHLKRWPLVSFWTRLPIFHNRLQSKSPQWTAFCRHQRKQYPPRLKLPWAYDRLQGKYRRRGTRQQQTSPKDTSSFIRDATSDSQLPTLVETTPVSFETTVEAHKQTSAKLTTLSPETTTESRTSKKMTSNPSDDTTTHIESTEIQSTSASSKDTSSSIRDATSDSQLPTLVETTPVSFETTVEAHKQTSAKLTTLSPETTTESRTSKKMTSNPLDDTTTHIESTEIQSTSASITTSSASTFSATTTTKPVTSANGRSTEALRTTPPAGM